MNDRISNIGQTAIETIAHPSPALFLHCALFLARNRLLSDETFRLVSFQGQESVSEPFEYQLELHANTSPRHGAVLRFDDVIGRPVTAGIEYPSNYTQAEMSERFQRALRGEPVGEELSLFNGIVTSFSMEIPGVYRLTMKPALWKMTLTNAYAIHKRMNVSDAIIKLLERHRIAYSLEAISGVDNPAIARVQDWLQAGETDLEFLRRLMGKAHLYYYFVHTANSHKLVFANRPETPYPHVFASRKPLRYTSTGVDETGLTQCDLISQYSYQRSLSSSAVHGVMTRQQAAWEEDPVAQFQSYHANSDSDLGDLPFNHYKIYQYGCSNDEAQHLIDATSSAMESAATQFSGSSTCAHFRIGHQFGVTGEDMADSHPMPVRPSLEGQRFVLTQVKHQASADGGYHNDFQATEASGFIAAFSMQETQQGLILAKVVAKAGNTTPQDWRYYTADYFDPETNAIVDSDCANPTLNAMGVYVRFSTEPEDSPPVWIKLAAHMQTVPEIGVTVLVSRAQDESELPEIQSIIQANGNMTITPSAWLASTSVGSSYSTSYGDSKSVRFGKNSSADLNHAVGINGPAYDSGKYRDTSYSQGASYSFTVSESNAKATPDSAELWGPYGGASDLLSASETFGSSYSRLHASVTSGFSQIGTSYNKSIIDNSVNNSTVGIQDNTSVTGMNTSASVLGLSISSDVTGSTTSTQLIGNTNSMQIVGVTNGMSMTGMSNQLSLNGISNGINLVGTSSNISATGESTSIGATGLRISAEAVGISASTSMTGISTSDSVLGMSSNTSMTGLTSEKSVTGMTIRNNAVGIATGVTAYVIQQETSTVQVKEHVDLSTAQMTVSVSPTGCNVTNAAGRVESAVVGPDINIPVIKIIM